LADYNNRQKTRFEEERARLVLLHIKPDRYRGAVLSESPDIICEESGIGVEVTSCMAQLFRERESIATGICGKLEEDLTEKQLKPIRNQDIRIKQFVDGRLIVGFAMWGDPFDIAPVLNDKIQKLNSTYRYFDTNELFVFAWLSDDDDLSKMISQIKTINFGTSKGFDSIYILREHDSSVEIYLIQKEEKYLFKMNLDDMNKISLKAKDTILQY